MRRNAIVMGATGLVGKSLVQQILHEDTYQTVTILVRTSTGIKHSKLQEVVIDFNNLEQINVDFHQADIFCTIGTTIKKAGSQESFRKVDFEYPLTLARLAKNNGARQFLVISSMGANKSSRTFYIRVKGEMEDALQNLNLPGLHIFRPSLLLGHREELRIGEGVASMLTPLVTPLLRGSFRKYRPIKATTVAKAMLSIAKQIEDGNHIYESDQIEDISIIKG